jgi:hypothetical protein
MTLQRSIPTVVDMTKETRVPSDLDRCDDQSVIHRLFPHRRARHGAAAMLVAVAFAAVSACGSDEAASSPDARTVTTGSGTADASTSPASPTTAEVPAADRVAAVATWLVDQAVAAGAPELDEDCVTDLLSQLGAADLALLEAAAADTSADATVPELSSEGEAIGEEVFSCLPEPGTASDPADESVVDAAVEAVLAEEPDVDEACLRSGFALLGTDELQVLLDEGSSSDNPKAQRVFLAVLGCLNDEQGAADGTTPATASAVEIPAGWPAGAPVLTSSDFFISADPAPPGEFEVVMTVQTPAIFQSAIDEWATSLGLSCIVDLTATGPQECGGSLPDGTTLAVTVDQEALFTPTPRFLLQFSTT